VAARPRRAAPPDELALPEGAQLAGGGHDDDQPVAP